MESLMVTIILISFLMVTSAMRKRYFSQVSVHLAYVTFYLLNIVWFSMLVLRMIR